MLSPCLCHKPVNVETRFSCHLLRGEIHVKNDTWKWNLPGDWLWLLRALCSLGLVVARGRIQHPLPGTTPSALSQPRAALAEGSPVQSLDLPTEPSQLAWGCPGDKKEQIWTNENTPPAWLAWFSG